MITDTVSSTVGNTDQGTQGWIGPPNNHSKWFSCEICVYWACILMHCMFGDFVSQVRKYLHKGMNRFFAEIKFTCYY